MGSDEGDSPPSEPVGDSGKLNEDTIQQFIEAQLEDARVRERELDLREQELEYNQQQAEASLEAQLEDRENQREYFDRIHRRNQRYGTAIISLVLFFLGFLVYIGQQQIALEIVKLAAFGGAGFWAGKKVGENTSEDAEA